MVDDVLSRLQKVRRSRNGWTALCPSHQDRESSLSIGIGDDGRVLLRCFAGCPVETIVKALGLELKDLFPHRRRDGRGGGGISISPGTRATVQPQGGLTLEQYAAAKRLPPDFLGYLRVSDMSYLGRPAIRMPYFDPAGTEIAVRFRLALEGENRFRWKTSTKPTLYGLWRLAEARAAGYVVLVEGESDCQTLWHHEIPALGVPGAASWRESWAKFFDNIPIIYVIIEPDGGGEAVRGWLATSRIRDRARLVDLGGAKDPSELHVGDPEGFRARWQAALAASVPWTEQAQTEAKARAREAWEQCQELARQPRILDRFAEDLSRHGVAGERRATKLLYLVLTSRLLDRPVSAAVKGPSSAGKSYIVEHTLTFFPPSAYYALSAMSDRALAYSEEPLVHRVLVLYEAVSLQSDFASYLVRSLLSEGRVRYETVEKTKDGLRPKLIEREGPTGLLVTTTAVKLQDENETRLFSIPVTDTPEQTKAVLRQQARAGAFPSVDLSRWHALQEWLAGSEAHVTIPYAGALAEAIPPVAVRLRRDFGAILSLVKAHAIVHQAIRDRDRDGAITATFDDYAVVRELVSDLVAEGVEATVSPAIRETVEAVTELLDATKGEVSEVTITMVAVKLKLGKGAALRRVQVAIEKGYLKNLEERRGRAARLVLGEPLPEDQEILPPADDPRLQGCTVARVLGEIDTPPSPWGSDPDRGGEPA